MDHFSLSSLTEYSDPTAEKRLADLEEQLRRLDDRDWWLWSLAVAVMMLLTFAVFSLSFPDLLKVDDPFFQYSLNRAVRGLIVLVLLFNGYTIYQQVTLKRLRHSFSKQLGETREMQARMEEIHKLAIKDPLTGLYNRRYARDRLTSETSRSLRYGHPLTVLALDLDKFKQINDTYGHPAGDEVLKAFCTRLNSAIRLSDLAARMGGDEFMLLLPEFTTDRVETILARLRPMEIEYGGSKIPIIFSAGWVAYEKGETVDQFLERADRTLYADKRTGKSPEKDAPTVVAG
jgi:diguanylate cyclase (GGDEF)-like protein